MSRSIHVPNIGHNAPIPLGARVGPLLCSSGIAGKDPATGALPADPLLQARNAFANLQALLAAGGATLADLAKLTITIRADSAPALREAINAEWQRCFPDPADRPARHILTHDLQHGMALQLECIAFVQKA